MRSSSNFHQRLNQGGEAIDIETVRKFAPIRNDWKQKEPQPFDQKNENWSELLSPFEVKLLKLALKYLNSKKQRELQLNQSLDDVLKDLYTREDISSDLSLIQAYKKKFDAIKNGEAVDAEFIMLQGIYLEEWFGAQANIFPTHQYDDFFNGIDCVALFRNEVDLPGVQGHLGIDVTTLPDSNSQILKKIDRTFDDLDRKKLSFVKYYQEKNDAGEIEYQKPLNTPRIILQTSSEMIEDMQKAFITTNDKKIARTLRNQAQEKIDEFGFIILKQAIERIVVYLGYIMKRYHRDNSSIYKEKVEQFTTPQLIEYLQNLFAALDSSRILTIQKEKYQEFKNDQESPYNITPVHLNKPTDIEHFITNEYITPLLFLDQALRQFDFENR